MTYLAADDRYDAMTYRRVGRSGIKLPLVSLGLWHNFGSDRPLETQRSILRRAFDLKFRWRLGGNAMPLRVVRRKDTGSLQIVGTIAGERIRRRPQTDNRRLASEEANNMEHQLLRAAFHGERPGTRSFSEAAQSYLRAEPRADGDKARVNRILAALTVCSILVPGRYDPSVATFGVLAFILFLAVGQAVRNHREFIRSLEERRL